MGCWEDASWVGLRREAVIESATREGKLPPDAASGHADRLNLRCGVYRAAERQHQDRLWHRHGGATSIACLHLLAVLLSAMVCAAAAQPATAEAAPETPAGVGIKVSFRPSIAIVVGIFTMIFSLTFLHVTWDETR